MDKHTPTLITERELIARIDRKLAPSGTALCHKPQTPAEQAHYDIIEMATNHLVRQDVSLEALAREIGALAEGEGLKN